jgi:hypothetical protein
MSRYIRRSPSLDSIHDTNDDDWNLEHWKAWNLVFQESLETDDATRVHPVARRNAAKVPESVIKLEASDATTDD